jgi:hypothetical protein
MHRPSINPERLRDKLNEDCDEVPFAKLVRSGCLVIRVRISLEKRPCPNLS